MEALSATLSLRDLSSEAEYLDSDVDGQREADRESNPEFDVDHSEPDVE